MPYGFIERDYVKIVFCMFFKLGLVPQNASKEEFAQALRTTFAIFGQSIKDISGGNLLAQLFEI